MKEEEGVIALYEENLVAINRITAPLVFAIGLGLCAEGGVQDPVKSTAGLFAIIFSSVSLMVTEKNWQDHVRADRVAKGDSCRGY